MSIIIDENKCIACGKCEQICPGNLIGKDEKGKAKMNYPKDCWGCAACVKECPAVAIHYYLGLDLNSKGGYLKVKAKGDGLQWQIIDEKGKEHIIQTNRKESNQY